MRSLVLALTLALLAIAAAPAAAGAKPRRLAPCAPRKQETIKARSAVAVVLVRWGDPWALIGCSRASGRRRVLASGPDDTTSSPAVIRVRGTTVGYVVYRHGLVVDDAVHRGRRRMVRPVRDFTAISDFVLGPGGAVAWFEASEMEADLFLARPGDVPRLLDEGSTLYDLAFGARSLTWQHDIATHTVLLAPPDRCPGTARVGGNALLDVLRTGLGAALCLRSSGAITDLGEADPEAVVLAGTGSWAAAWSGPELLAADGATGERRTLATAGTAGPLTIDEHGSVAWAEVSHAPDHTIIHADDAAGPRVAWEGDVAVPFLQHDRSVVWFWRLWQPLVVPDSIRLAP
jgi:hypothetical protein